MNLTLVHPGSGHMSVSRSDYAGISVRRGMSPNRARTRRSESRRSAVSSQVTGIVPEDGASGEFGANEWLVDEMYERYLANKESVDKSWWPILENYKATKDAVPT